MAKIDQLLQIVKDARATDLHLAAGSVPVIRVNGQLEKTRHKKLTADNIRQLLYEILTDDQIRQFETEGDLDAAYGVTGIARFRINLYRMQGGIGAALRLIPDEFADLNTLGFSKTVSKREIIYTRLFSPANITSFRKMFPSEEMIGFC